MVIFRWTTWYTKLLNAFSSLFGRSVVGRHVGHTKTAARHADSGPGRRSTGIFMNFIFLFYFFPKRSNWFRAFDIYDETRLALLCVDLPPSQGNRLFLPKLLEEGVSAVSFVYVPLLNCGISIFCVLTGSISTMRGSKVIYDKLLSSLNE